MNIGYARVSTSEQVVDLQEDALRKAGCEKVFTDTISGAATDRPGLQEALAFARQDDCLVVWRLDRLGRSLPHLIQVVQGLAGRGVNFRSLNESLDTSSAGGRLLFHIMGALAEFERSLIRERTVAGLAAARARGRSGGRPRAMDDSKVKMARQLLRDPSVSVGEICRTLSVSRSTLYKYAGFEASNRGLQPGARVINVIAGKRTKV